MQTDTGDATTLDRDKVVRAAVDLADRVGITSLTIRKLAARLDVTPMAIYHHVADKSEVLDGMVDVVFSEIELPDPRAPWRDALRRRATSAREVLARHPWATGLMDSRSSPGPATLRHHDAVVGCLRAAGFTVVAAAHAYALLDSYIYGFAIQESSLPFTSGPEVSQGAATIVDAMPAGRYPHLVELATHLVMRDGYDFADEFDYGLELVLDAIDRARVDERELSSGSRGEAHQREGET